MHFCVEGRCCFLCLNLLDGYRKMTGSYRISTHKHSLGLKSNFLFNKGVHKPGREDVKTTERTAILGRDIVFPLKRYQ